MKTLSFLLAFLFTTLSLRAQTVVDFVVNSSDHSTLETAVLAAGLETTLSGPGPFTLFAPTNAAFAALDPADLQALLDDPQGALTDVLTYHAVPGNTQSGDLSDQQIITTINGKDVTITVNADGVFINDAQVTMADVPATNGVVHVINAVLIPPTVTVVDIVVNSPDHNILETAVIEAGLVGTLSGPGPFTVFAPTDDAFDALPAGLLDDLLADPSGALTDILLYHALPAEVGSGELSNAQIATTINGVDIIVTIDGDDVIINNALVTMADVPADNGVVHVIDAVLIPNTITDLVVYSPVHTTLETAVVEAGLAATLAGDGPFTVFAPTDDAFDALPAGALDDLLADPTGALADVLLYHAVEGTAFSGDLADGQTIPTINGAEVMVTIDADGVFINDAEVIVADVNTANGVVHIIDMVLLPPPPSNTIVDIVVNSPDHNTLETAVIEAGLVGTLSGPGPFTVFAPTDDAFDALPAGLLDDLLADPSGALTDILLYHALPAEVGSGELSNAQIATTINGVDIIVTIDGDDVIINNALVTMADVPADNGVVHVIDAVLIPNTITDLVVYSPVHTTLETAVVEAGLAATLAGDGPFTVFAPTDDAFADLPAGALDDLLADPTGALTDVLTYHVANGATFAGDLSNGQSIETLNTASVTITIDADGVFVNDAEVIVADVNTVNGVVHIIDMVLLPPTSVSELSAEFANVQVFPNPATDFVTIDLNTADSAIEEVILANANGQIMATRKESTNRLNYNLSAVPNGTYYLILTIDGTRFSQSVQVQH